MHLFKICLTVWSTLCMSWIGVFSLLHGCSGVELEIRRDEVPDISRYRIVTSSSLNYVYIGIYVNDCSEKNIIMK